MIYADVRTMKARIHNVAGGARPGKCEQTCFVNQNRTEPRPTHPILDPILDPIFKKAFCAKIGCKIGCKIG